MSRGFSLIETVIAIGLIVSAVLMLAQLIAASVHTTALAQYRSISTIIGQQKMEQLRVEATLGDVDAAVEHFDGSGRSVCGTPVPCPDAVFSVRWTVVSPAHVPGMVLIHLAVSHAHGHYGEVRSFAMRSRSVR